MPGERQALQHLFELVEAGIPPSAETMAQCRAALEPERFTDRNALMISNVISDGTIWSTHQMVHKVLKHLANVALQGKRRVRLVLDDGNTILIELEK